MLACQEGAGGSRVEEEQGGGKGAESRCQLVKVFYLASSLALPFLKARAHDSPGDFCLGICLRHAGAEPPSPSPSLSPQFTVPQPEAVAELRQAPDSVAPFSQSFVFLCAYLYFAAFAFFSLSIV